MILDSVLRVHVYLLARRLMELGSTRLDASAPMRRNVKRIFVLRPNALQNAPITLLLVTILMAVNAQMELNARPCSVMRVLVLLSVPLIRQLGSLMMDASVQLMMSALQESAN